MFLGKNWDNFVRCVLLEREWKGREEGSSLETTLVPSSINEVVLHCQVTYKGHWNQRRTIDIVIRGIDKNLLLLLFFKKRASASLFHDNFE